MLLASLRNASRSACQSTRSRHDRPPHLGLQLVGDDALRDLVDLGRGEVRELGHALGELGDAAREVRLALGLRGYVVASWANPSVNLHGLHLLHNL